MFSSKRTNHFQYTHREKEAHRDGGSGSGAVYFLCRWRYLCVLCGYELLKLLTAKGAKNFREVREEQRVL
jgi:hypothetical protein